MATEAKPRAPTMSADIAIFFIGIPFSLRAPAVNGKNRQWLLLRRHSAKQDTA
ncbi:hypothetical protein ACFPFP_14995 [Bradyrhizobium sp. GCM10023182]|uniref:Uncharacterized protein n=1 Tax=Bradyrhizobium zhengyangense TaxID=2911009 RepID=A0ABS9LN49_9BRAD|nr:hypothetical protein [Bradyrhizobium zhengyangense]